MVLQLSTLRVLIDVVNLTEHTVRAPGTQEKPVRQGYKYKM